MLTVYTGVVNWQLRVWSLVTVLRDGKLKEMSDLNRSEEFLETEKKIRKMRNEKIGEVCFYFVNSILYIKIYCHRMLLLFSG